MAHKVGRAAAIHSLRTYVHVYTCICIMRARIAGRPAIASYPGGGGKRFPRSSSYTTVICSPCIYLLMLPHLPCESDGRCQNLLLHGSSCSCILTSMQWVLAEFLLHSMYLFLLCSYPRGVVRVYLFWRRELQIYIIHTTTLPSAAHKYCSITFCYVVQAMIDSAWS